MEVIRKATIGDAETINTLANEIWPRSYSGVISDDQIAYMLRERYSVQELANQIAQNLQTYFLIIEDTRPVGFASYGPVENDPHTFRLHKLYCLPSTHGKGYGKALLYKIINEVKQHGANALELNVHRQNPAKTFYDKMGFEVVFEVDIPMGPYFLNDYIMRKQL